MQQQVDAARVGAADHPQLGGGVRAVRPGDVVRVGLVQAQHRAVQQRGVAEQGALVQPLVPGVEQDLSGGRPLRAPAHAHRAGEGPGDRAEGGARRGGDQHVRSGGGPPGLCPPQGALSRAASTVSRICISLGVPLCS